MQDTKSKKFRVILIIVLLLAVIGIVLFIWHYKKAEQPLPEFGEPQEPLLTPLDDAPTFELANLNVDSDNDGYTDLVEDYLGLNKNEPEVYSKTNAITFEVTDGDKLSLSLIGTPNIATVSVAENTDISIKGRAYMLSPIYEFYIDNFQDNVFSAELTLEFDDTGMSDADRQQVIIYQYLDDGSILPLDDCIVKGNKVTAHLKHFSKYFAAHKKLTTWEGFKKVGVYFLIDDSGSMYSASAIEKQFKVDIEDTDEVSLGKDPLGVRWNFTSYFLQHPKLEKDLRGIVKLGVSSYTLEPTTLINYGDLDDLTSAKEIIDNYKKVPRSLDYLISGTSMYNAVKKGVDILEHSDVGTKYIIILTDSNQTDLSDVKELIRDHPNIIPITICIGCNSNELAELAYSNKMGCYHIASSMTYTTIADKIFSSLMPTVYEEISFADIKKSGSEIVQTTKTIKAVPIADSGFRRERDGFPIHNFSSYDSRTEVTTGGACFGFSEAAKKYYMDQVMPPKGMTYYTGDLINETVNTSKLPADNITPFTTISDFSSYATGDLCNCSYNYLQKLCDEGILYPGTYTEEETSYPVLVFNPDEALPIFNEHQNTYVANCFGEYHKFKVKNKFNLTVSYECCGVLEPKLDVVKFTQYLQTEDFANLSKTQQEELTLIHLILQLWDTQKCIRDDGTEAYLHYFYSTYYDENTFKSDFIQLGNIFKYIDNGRFVFLKDVMLCEMINSLNHGVPANLSLVATSASGGGGHSILCQRILRDLNNPNIVYLECYDSNCFDTTTYLTIKYKNLIGAEYKDGKLPPVEFYSYSAWPNPLANLWVSELQAPASLYKAEG